MGMFTITIKTDNATFEDDGLAGAIELAACLSRVATALLDGWDWRARCRLAGEKGVVKDTNGNAVGTWTWED